MERFVNLILQCATLAMIIAFVILPFVPDIGMKILGYTVLVLFGLLFLGLAVLNPLWWIWQNMRKKFRTAVHLPTFEAVGLAIKECLTCGRVYVTMENHRKMMIRAGISGGTEHICKTTFLSNMSELESESAVARLAHTDLLSSIDYRHDVTIVRLLVGALRQCLGDEELATMTIAGINDYYAKKLSPVERAWADLERIHVPPNAVLEFDHQAIPGICDNYGSSIVRHK